MGFPHKYSKEQKEEALRLYQEGMPLDEIVAKTGAGKGVFYGWLKRSGAKALRRPGIGGRKKKEQGSALPTKRLAPSPLIYSGKLPVDAFDREESNQGLRVLIIEGEISSVLQAIKQLK